MPTITKRQRELNRKTIERIAELKIKEYNLPDTIEEYIQKCIQNTNNR